MRRASRGRLLVPGSWSEVGGNAAFMVVVAEAVVAVVVGLLFAGALLPLDCCDGCCCEAGWGCVGGLSVGALFVAGGVEMPFCMFSAAGEAIVPLCPYIAKYLTTHDVPGAEIRWPNRPGTAPTEA